MTDYPGYPCTCASVMPQTCLGCDDSHVADLKRAAFDRARVPTKPSATVAIDHEKQEKPRPDLVPPRAIAAAGRAMAAGVRKHGGGTTGRGTYRDPGDQGTVAAHVASFERHWLAVRQALHRGTTIPIDAGTGLSELDCAAAQLAMVVDLVEDPVVSVSVSVSAGDPWALPEGLFWRTSCFGNGWVITAGGTDELWRERGTHVMCGALRMRPDAGALIDLIQRRNAADPAGAR